MHLHVYRYMAKSMHYKKTTCMACLLNAARPILVHLVFANEKAWVGGLGSRN